MISHKLLRDRGILIVILEGPLEKMDFEALARNGSTTGKGVSAQHGYVAEDAGMV